MSLRGSSDWKSKVFDLERQDHAERTRTVSHSSPRYVKTNVGWILFGPQDVRDSVRRYHFALQQLYCDKQVRVRVGCRYYTLPQAWKHWSKKVRFGGNNSNEGRQALAIISLMILQAQAFGLLPRYSTIKFDSSIVKPKRK